eukprot:TRINITY_DN27110_c0_g1_i1.p1 TRINITY_DN27110_c0_g1~~TRINITY_DN27110_c0_g1_i1.p1  ORF type:complete len:550 (+),score=158.67 TRINITY_DN27110_c0_g1_i1:81-1730(+)
MRGVLLRAVPTRAKALRGGAVGFRLACHRLFSEQTAVASGSFALFKSVEKGTDVLEAYTALVDKNILRHDEVQLRALEHLSTVQQSIKGYTPAVAPKPAESAGFFGGMFGSAAAEEEKPVVEIPRGVYVWGGPGSGKSLTMDLFFHCTDAPSRRVHFNEFMIDVHKRLHQLRDTGSDAIPKLSEELISQGWLLCFDEFQVVDIGDALLMKRLFEGLWEGGAVMVATSNRAPDELYKNGLQRRLFEPFIPLLKEHCPVYHMNSQVDYRLTGTNDAQSKTYVTPLGPDTDAAMQSRFETLASGHVAKAATLRTRFRTISVPEAARGVARFKFENLCSTKVGYFGAADYMAVANQFHSVVIEDVPQLFLEQINEVRRFITCVDQLYERKVKLFVSAEVPLEELFIVASEKEAAEGKAVRSGDSDKDEAFAWERTMSRLMEMQTTEYLRAAHQKKEVEILGQLDIQHLNERDSMAVFEQYDVDGDGVLDRKEFRSLLEDLSQLKRGHKNVDDQLLEATFEEMDENTNGLIEPDEFLVFCLKYGMEYELSLIHI